MFGFFGFFETVFPIVFSLMFVVVIGFFIFTLVKHIGSWHKNNNSPKLSVDATVVGKRNNVYRHHMNDHTSYHTEYFVTFQFQSGDRLELSVPGDEVGLLVEGDEGILSFQGTRYLGFERK